MQELYYINGYKEDGKKGCTWNKLLQWCHEQISKVEPKWYCRENIVAYLPQRIHDFFSGWRHNANDGGYWTEGRYDRIFVGFDENNQKIEVNGEWHNPEWKIKGNGTFVSDSYGRIIPSGYIKACYLRFKPVIAPVVKYKRKSWTWYNRLYDYNRDFRKGPVPDHGRYRKHCGRRYKGDHGGFGNEARQDAIFVAELKDINKEFGVNVKYNRGRVSDVWGLYTDWDYYHWHSKGYGWKRTRKKKQWM